MLFVTVPFLIFFLILFTIYWILPVRWRSGILLIASLVFYGTWSIPFAIHLVFIIALNHAVIELWRLWPKNWLFYSLQLFNVLNISIFKYYYFFFDIIGHLFGVQEWMSPNLRLTDRLEGAEILLPLGISFYTFQIMSYGIDIYRGVYTQRHRFVEVLLYILFFPQLIAGPIMRGTELLPQIQSIKEKTIPDPDTFRKAVWLLLAGVFKKLLIADRLAPVIAPFMSGDLSQISSPMIWLYSFTTLAMLYADFSAYTDLARGMGLLLGFDIPINFRAPFFMVSISDFWRRWHLTFSRWIRDYIYIPLGGSRVPEMRNYLNLIITFFAGGLWHGASYNFVTWGLLIGLILSLEGFVFRRGWMEWPDTWPERILRLTISWFLLLSTSVFFFSPGFDRSLELLSHMFSFQFEQKLPVETEMILYGLVAVFFFQAIEQWPERFQQLRKYDRWLLPLCVILVLSLILQYSGGVRDFFYFQF